MRLSVWLGAFSIALAAGAASAQKPDGVVQVEATPVTISGDVVRYEPGRVIVIRGQDGRDVPYTLSPRITVPDVQVGQKVTLYTERSANGSPTTVSRVVTTSVSSGGNVKAVTDETRTTASGRVTKTHSTTINGEVVRYEPGQRIVVREPSRKVVTYTLAPDVSVPADIQVGRKVTLYTESVADGSTMRVRRVTTNSVTAEGRAKNSTEETRTDASGATTTTTTTHVSGRVDAYTAGKSITVLGSDGSRATYLITPDSTVPQNLGIGRNIILVVPANPRERVVRTIMVSEP
jgi:hypothetical protein